MEHEQIAARLRLALERAAARHELSAGAWPQIERRLRRQAWRRAAIAAVCVAVVAAAATAAPYLRHAVSGPAVSHPRPAPELVVGGRTRLSPGIIKVVTGYRGVWVLGSGVIYRVDPATGKTVTTIPAPGAGAKLGDITAGAGAVWVIRTGPHPGVYRIDPRRNRIASFIRLPLVPSGVMVAYGRVWVTEPRQGPGLVVRIDPRTSQVSGPPIRVGISPGRIVAGFGALWVTGGSSNSWLSRINPATGAVTRVLANIERVDAVGAGSLWVIPTRGGIQRVDPVTGRATATIRVPNAASVTFWAGSAWVSAEPPGTIVRIDPASNRITGKPVPAGTTPIDTAAGPNGLWVADFDTGELLHLAPAPLESLPGAKVGAIVRSR
jgi:streptogramin lyase